MAETGWFSAITKVWYLRTTVRPGEISDTHWNPLHRVGYIPFGQTAGRRWVHQHRHRPPL